MRHISARRPKSDLRAALLDQRLRRLVPLDSPVTPRSVQSEKTGKKEKGTCNKNRKPPEESGVYLHRGYNPESYQRREGALVILDGCFRMRRPPLP
ncbi:hypothetical protein OPV22_024805 [Ensete ventricosum]|uniref:Uncharacterized protein n=1 Tax=Ensete ventricosum TaxID=4639 RepID=A0AAV8QFX3_ENSVE|nr:hypothetical protein OPV22_024805 [Ensete ventricosum]